MNETTELLFRQFNQKKTHAETHELGGGDEIDVAKLKGIGNYVTKTGDFSGTWNGLAMTAVDVGLETAFNALKADTATIASCQEFQPRNHNAFSGLVWNGTYNKYFLVFRGGATHVEVTGAIFMSSSQDGITWSDPAIIIDTALDDRDPTLFVDSNGDMLLAFFQYQNSGTAMGTRLLYKSTNGGATWASFAQITQAGTTDDFGMSPIVKAANGNLLITGYGNTGNVRLYRSTNNGATWTLTFTFTIDSAISPNESTLHVRNDGSIVCFIRSDASTQADIYYSVSTDNGTTWSAVASLGIEGKPGGVIEKDDFIYLGARVHNDYAYFGQVVIYKLKSSDLSYVEEFIIDNSYDVDCAYVSFASKDNVELVFSYHTKLPLSASVMKAIKTSFSAFNKKKRLINGEHDLNSHNAPFILVGDDPTFPTLTLIQNDSLGEFYSLVDSTGNVILTIGTVSNADPSLPDYVRYIVPSGGRTYFDGQYYFRSDNGATSYVEINSIGTLVSRIGQDFRGTTNTYNTRVLRIDGNVSSGYVPVSRLESGTTANRPVGVVVGYQYFDTTLGKPVWLKTGSTWVDATGAIV